MSVGALIVLLMTMLFGASSPGPSGGAHAAGFTKTVGGGGPVGRRQPNGPGAGSGNRDLVRFGDR